MAVRPELLVGLFPQEGSYHLTILSPGTKGKTKGNKINMIMLSLFCALRVKYVIYGDLNHINYVSLGSTT